MAVPESIGYMEDVGVNKLDGDVGVCMSRRIVFEFQSRAIEMELLVPRENLCRKCALGSRRKGEVPTFNARGDREVFERIFARGDLSANRVQPFVAVGVVEMPMSINQMLDRIGTEA